MAIAPMKLKLEFQSRDRRLYVRTGRLVGLNIARALETPSCIDALISQKEKLHSRHATLDTTHHRVMRGIQLALARGDRFHYSDYKSIREMCAKIQSGLWNITKDEWEPSESTEYSSRMTNSVRYGNVELRVIENFIYQRDELLSTATEIAKQIADGAFQIRGHQQDSGKWLSASDIGFNIQALMTNAGFYLPTNPAVAAIVLEHWCELYFDELVNSAIFDYPPAYTFYYPVLQAICQLKGSVPLGLTFPSPFRFYELLTDKRVLFVTPFAEKINNLHASGKMLHLYTDRVLPRFHLKAIPAPMSVYPRRPHGSWKESYDFICSQIDAELGAGRYDLFIASSGCYGIPLCGYARKTHGLSTLYFGNHINTLFGIMQQCSRDFMATERNAVNWQDGELADIYPEVRAIDDGRYV